jgi:hypothetical protein
MVTTGEHSIGGLNDLDPLDRHLMLASDTRAALEPFGRGPLLPSPLTHFICPIGGASILVVEF